MRVRRRAQGYDLGDVPEDLTGVGDSIIKALRTQEQFATVSRGAPAVEKIPVAVGSSVGAEVSPRDLRESLMFDEHWGPTEWGPIPFLPKPDLLVEAMEKAWGDLYSYRGINSTAKGNLLVSGVQARCA
jgi:magnesium chelatase subunit H